MSARSRGLEMGVSGGARGISGPEQNELGVLTSPPGEERDAISQNQRAKSIALTWHFFP